MTVKVVIIKKSRFSGVPIIIQFFCIVQVNLVLRVVNANLRAKVYKSCKAKTTFSLSSDYHRGIPSYKTYLNHTNSTSVCLARFIYV